MIPFTKAHACGNDFLIVTEEAASGFDYAELTRALCARHTGIGADGIEFFAWTGPNAGRIRLHNDDGSIAELSGNGTRCVAAWMAEQTDAKPGDEMAITTDAGLRRCRINAIHTDAGRYTIETTTGMGLPTCAPKIVTLADGARIAGADISMGNPHFVIRTESEDFSVAGRTWQEIGNQICHHADFPHQTNVEFIRILENGKIEIRIFERGVGPTTSSGTGSSASATAAIALHNCASSLIVVAPGGAQTVDWRGLGTELFLTGPASLVARGQAWNL